MIRRAPRPTSGFLILDNTVARDKRLSFRALGVLVEILSRPDNWRVDRDQLARGEGREGVAAVRTALKELEDTGYMVRRRVRRDDGRFGWEHTVYDRPVSAGHTTGRIPADGPPPVVNQPSLEEPSTKNLEEDVVEWVPSADADGTPHEKKKFNDWRTEDRALFAEVVGDALISDGSVWKAGTYAADAWYEAFRKRKAKPIDWPGRFVSTLNERDGVEEYLASVGVELA